MQEITDVIQKPDAHEKSEKIDHAEWKDREDKETLTENIELRVSKKEKVKKLFGKTGKRESSDMSKASGESFKTKKVSTLLSRLIRLVSDYMSLRVNDALRGQEELILR